MSRSNSYETDYLELLFNNTDITGIGDAGGIRGSVAAGDLFVSLHTADPGEAGLQNTNEATFGAYARQPVARSGAGWTVAADQVSNAALIAFLAATTGPQTITHVGVGVALSGATQLLWSGMLASAKVVEVDDIVQFLAGDLVIDTD